MSPTKGARALPTITIEAGRMEVVRIDVDPQSVRERGGVVDLLGASSSAGRRVSGSTTLVDIVPSDLRASLLDGRVRTLRLWCGTGQVLPVSAPSGEDAEPAILRGGRREGISDVALGSLLAPEQRRHLLRTCRSWRRG